MGKATLSEVFGLAAITAQAFARHHRWPRVWAILTYFGHLVTTAGYVVRGQVYRQGREAAVIVVPSTYKPGLREVGLFTLPVAFLVLLVIVLPAAFVLLLLTVLLVLLMIPLLGSVLKPRDGSSSKKLKKLLAAQGSEYLIFYSLARSSQASAGAGQRLLASALTQAGAVGQPVGCIADSVGLVPFYLGLGFTRIGQSRMFFCNSWTPQKTVSS